MAAPVAGKLGGVTSVVDGGERRQLVDAVMGIDHANGAAARAHHQALRASRCLGVHTARPGEAPQRPRAARLDE